MERFFPMMPATQDFRTRVARAVAETTAVTALATSVAWVLTELTGFRNADIVFLPAILYSSVFWGPIAGSATAVFSVLMYNFFFMEPLNAFGISGIEDVATVAAFLAVAFITGSLAMKARDQARTAEAERFSGALLGSISHNMRTPLAAILGGATAILSNPGLKEAARRELLCSIRDEASRLDRFITHLLNMTRLQAGQLRPNREPIDPAEVVGAALALLAPRLTSHALVLEVAPDLPLVSLDPVLFEHVIENVLDNAARHTPPGKRIGVTAAVRGEELTITVDDEGGGIGAENRVRVFDKFFSRRADSGDNGTGLGLTIAKGFVEAHGGTITASESRWGGARFTIAVPA